ncbi:hypothetical protein J4573_46235 [Actinomadura barringtoniae]|uniref:YncE family protein n=1 Tax=Actinomadura barringtoniae TaxID=1427535 RepID=A0A939PKP5_9ACTN|nr:hypothetical protein [Actinomadura barringtoniae]MBO2454556.1 hypothetical protein [Actinomadura barringtoniae]
MTSELLAVADHRAGVGLFDTASFEHVETIAVPPEPHELAFDPARRLLYATITYRSGFYGSEAKASELVVIDVDRRSADVVDLAPEHAPHGIVVRGDLVYVSVEAGPAGEGGLLVIDAGTRKVVDRIATGAPGPHWFALTPDGAKAYVSNKEAPFVSVVDLASCEVVGRIPVPSSEGLAMTPDGRRVFVASPMFGREPGPGDLGIRVIDTAAGEVVQVLEVGGQVIPVHVTADGTLLAAEVAHDGGRVNVYEPDSLALRGSVDVGVFPLTLHSSPDGSRAYAANGGSGTVSVVDLKTLRVTATMNVSAGSAHGLAIIPA